MSTQFTSGVTHHRFPMKYLLCRKLLLNMYNNFYRRGEIYNALRRGCFRPKMDVVWSNSFLRSLP